MNTKDIDHYLQQHYIHRSNWLRATVLGANDGILSIASIAIGVSTASSDRNAVVLATLAGLVAGALSMAAGEYVSVSSQTDTENADIERERQELIEDPEDELRMLANIYINRGLQEATAYQVARELTEHDALGAHVRDELGINDINQANPLQAAIASGAAFTLGGIFPFISTLIFPLKEMSYYIYFFSILSLILLGYLSAKTGGSKVMTAILRLLLWGTATMGLTALVGYYFDVNL